MTRAMKKQPRRKFSVPFSISGLIRSLQILALIVFVAGAAWGFDLLYKKYDAPVAVIGIEGELKQVSATDVEQIVATSLGGGFLSLDLQGICEALEEHPWISRASARRKWPNEVVISVDEESPIARWGDDKFLNNQGRLLRVADAQLSKTLPLLNGPEGMERRVMQQYRNFSQILRPLELEVEICELAPRGNWLLTLDNGMQLSVGKEPVAGKFKRFMRVWDEALRDRSSEITHVDIRYGNGVAVKWKEQVEIAETTDKG